MNTYDELSAILKSMSSDAQQVMRHLYTLWLRPQPRKTAIISLERLSRELGIALQDIVQSVNTLRGHGFVRDFPNPEKPTIQITKDGIAAGHFLSNPSELKRVLSGTDSQNAPKRLRDMLFYPLLVGVILLILSHLLR